MKKVGEYLIRGLMAVFAALPLGVHYFNARILAWLAGSVFRYRRAVVEDNLRHSFPDKDEAAIKALTRDFYNHFADLVVEAVWFGGCRNPKRLRRSHIVEVANPEEMAHLTEVAPSVSVMYSHTGNWELLGGIASYNYSDIDTGFTEQNFCVVYLKQSDPGMDGFLRKNRTAPLIDPEGYPGYLESREVVRYVFEHRAEKKIYNFITDQHPYFKSKDFLVVNFMHRDCDSMRGAAALACKFGMAVCYMGMPSDSRGHYKIEYTTIADDASDMDPDDIMRQYYKLLEKDLQAQPWNYLWTHNRWKRFPK